MANPKHNDQTTQDRSAGKSPVNKGKPQKTSASYKQVPCDENPKGKTIGQGFKSSQQMNDIL